MELLGQEKSGASDNNNYNNNIQDNNYVPVIIAQSHCEISPGGSFDECRLSVGWPPTLRPSQPTSAVSPPIISN